MNKTIIINISGIVFHIEETAYDTLRNYMIDVKKHFGISHESQEIVEDIENRIAEMFSETLAEGKKEVITAADVDLVIARMGRVEDFENDPVEENSNYSDTFIKPAKKLLRDPDDKYIGGVCSGLGYYFGIGAKWVRLLFVLLVIFGGSGVLIYLILWVVIPKANNRISRMQMRGEPINLHNFQRNLEDEMSGLRSVLKGTADTNKNALNSLGDIIVKTLKIIIKIIAGIIIIGLIIALIVLIVSVFATFEFFGKGHEMSMFPVNVFEEDVRNNLLICLFFLAAVPIIALMGLITNLFFNKKIIGRYFGFALLLIWVVSAGMGIIYGTRVAKDFQSESKVLETRLIGNFENYEFIVDDVSQITMYDTTNRNEAFQESIAKRGQLISQEMNKVFVRVIPIDPNQAANLDIHFFSKGNSYEDATNRIERIHYEYAINDNILHFNNQVLLPMEEPFREQSVNLEVSLPVGSKLLLDRKTSYYVRRADFSGCLLNYEKVLGTSPQKLEWIVKPTGLECAVEAPILEENDPQDNSGI